MPTPQLGGDWRGHPMVDSQQPWQLPGTATSAPAVASTWHGGPQHSRTVSGMAWHGITGISGCGMVSHSMTWCTISCNFTPHHALACGIAWCAMALHGIARHWMAWHGILWHCPAWHDLAWPEVERHRTPCRDTLWNGIAHRAVARLARLGAARLVTALEPVSLRAPPRRLQQPGDALAPPPAPSANSGARAGLRLSPLVGLKKAVANKDAAAVVGALAVVLRRRPGWSGRERPVRGRGSRVWV